MPRDGSGNYTLPAGNPVVSGTVITPTWANPTMSDIGQELTDSLSRSGKGGMNVAFQNVDGTNALPGITWTAEPSTGFYRADSSDMRASVTSFDKTRWIAGDLGFEVWDGAAWQKPAYGGIAQTIAGAWDFTTQPTFNGDALITVGDIPSTYVQRNVDELVSGEWTFGQVIQGVTSGNLVALDLAGYTQAGVAEVITATWRFDNPLQMATGSVILSGGGNAQLRFNDAAEALRWRLGPTGSPGDDFILFDDRIGNIVFTISDTDSSTRFVQPLFVTDLNSQIRKAGYRNPGARGVTGADTLLQSDEGQIVQCNAGIVSITVDALEANTTMTILNRTDDDVPLLAGSASIEWYSGSGVFEGGDRVLAGRSVVQIHYRAANAVSLWGNGIR